MKNDNVLRTASFTISNTQYDWLAEQSKKRLLAKSVVLREAIELLRKDYNNVKSNNRESITPTD